MSVGVEHNLQSSPSVLEANLEEPTMKKTKISNSEEIEEYIKDIRKIKVVSHIRQEEIFDVLFSKNHNNDEKSLDKPTSMSDNIVIETPKETDVVVENKDLAEVRAGKKEYVLRYYLLFK